MVRTMKQFRANQGRFGQNKARLGQSKCGFANLQTRINTGGEGGIRTHGTISGTLDFELCPFDRL